MPSEPEGNRRTTLRRYTLTLLTLLAGCTGSIGEVPEANDPGGPSDGPGAMNLPPGVLDSCDEEASAPPSQRVWMLQYGQIAATMDGVYGDLQGGPAYDFVSEDNATYSGRRSDLIRISSENVRQMLRKSEDIAAFVSERIGSFVACDPSDVSCLEAFIREFTLRAWRQPANDDQTTRLRAIYDIGAEVSIEDAYRLVVTAILRSPRFLFRTEIGEADGAEFVLTPYELASQLSYFLWDGPPDAELYALAEDGSLGDGATFERQVDRMLNDQRARGVASRFVDELVAVSSLTGIAKSEELGEIFDRNVTDTLREEVRLFSEHVVFDSEGTVEELLTSRETFANETVGRFYGAEVAGEEFQPFTAPAPRQGLLTQPAVMAVHAAMDHVVPTNRGRLILNHFLCAPLGSPPEIPDEAPAASPGLSPRERLAVMQDYPQCASCHNRADPIGFAFDHFDAIGRFVTESYGAPVDDSGAIIGTEESDGTFANLDGLISRLVDSREVRSCIGRQFFEFAEGRLATVGDGCRMFDLQAAFEESGGNMRLLIRDLLTTAHTKRRSVSP